MSLFRKGPGGYVGVANGRETLLLHKVVAEMALGKPLPKGAVVHHIDGNKKNNFTCNLVICQSQAYHKLLHIRADALEICGNANWRRCKFCKEYDDPINMNFSVERHRKTPRQVYYHSKCNSEYCRKMYQKKRIKQ